MENNRKFGFIMLIIGIIIALLLFLLLTGGNEVGVISNKSSQNNSNNGSSSNNNSIDNKNGNQQNSNSNDNSEKTKNVETNLTTVKDYQAFFTANNLINDYYLNINDTSAIIDILDSDYKALNGVNKDNVKNLLGKNSGISFISRKAYVKSKNNISYIFVNGEEQFTNYITSESGVNKNVEYLVIIDSDNRTYSIRPLKVGNLIEYGQNYKMRDNKSISENDNNRFIQNSFSDENISLFYVTYFKQMLMYSPEDAYNMLSDTSKASYLGYEDFLNHVNEIFSTIPNSLLNYSASGENGKRVYHIIGTNQKKLMFEENAIMDYKVTFE